MILCIAYCIYKKQYKDIIMMLPILGLWITAIAAPMVDIRYIYPMFLGTPIFMGIIGKNSKENIWKLASILDANFYLLKKVFLLFTDKNYYGNIGNREEWKEKRKKNENISYNSSI